MSIAVISDLHLGPGDESDLFRHHDHQFLKFLSFLEQNFERIVLLGDIWETLTPRWPCGQKSALQKSRRAHPEIARRFELPKYQYVHGNHDVIAGASEGAPEELVLDWHGARILLTHGHRHDALLRRAPWISEFGVWLGAWLLRLRGAALYRAFDALDRLRSGFAVQPERCTFQRWAVSLAQVRRADIVVTGHTHVPLRVEHPGALFLNSGSCSNGRFSFLSIDPRRGAFHVHDAW